MQTTQLARLLPKDVADRLLAFKQDVMRALPGAVEEVILFGSRARGDAQADSDYDLAVLLKDGLAGDLSACRRMWDAAWDYKVDGLYIQAIPLDADALSPAQTELAMRIAAEGVPLR
jgi:predicted nucleotidyltransferase